MKDNKLNILNQYWGFSEFRPLQEEIIDQVIQKKDVLALLPTGGGKSICYQLPAMLMEGLCIVISPLIALMQDQVESLQEKGIRAELINSSIDRKNIDRILDNCIYGKVKLLYIAPERIQSQLFKERFKKMNISFVAVDEAHCISQWGNDFRPNYRTIAILKEWNRKVKFIALTATATKLVTDDIQKQLSFGQNNSIKKSFYRKNIRYEIINCVNKVFVLEKIVKNECSIIYVRSRKNAEKISYFLKSKGKSVDFYHAGLKADDRAKKQKEWVNNEFDIIVATNAFGMGIDKSNVRTVIHFELPESIESFYQESGRAGRDGESSYSIILKETSDEISLIEKIKSKQPNIEITKEVFQQFCNYHQIGIGYSSKENYEVDFELIANKSKQSKYETYYVFKQLIKDGFLKESDSGNYLSKIKFIATIPAINHFLNKYPRFERIVDTLMRSYGDILHQEISVSENVLAHRLNLINSNLKESLKELSKFEIINYQPRNKTYQIQFCSPRPDISKLKLSKNIALNYQNTFQKAMSLCYFVKNHKICRNKILLEYFNEKASEKCGNCDNCLNHLEKLNNPKKIIENAIKILLKYEEKSPKDIYNELSEVIKKDEFKIVLKSLLNEEILILNKNNLVHLSD